MTVDINPTQASMLGLFGSHSVTGYDIFEMADKTMRPYWSVTKSQVYRELTSMEEMGLIKKDGAKKPFRNRQFYKLTNKGRQTFYDWLTSPVPDDITRTNLAVRIAFAQNLTKTQLSKLVKEGLANAKRELTRIRNTQDMAEKQGLDWDVVALRLAEMQQQTVIRWLNDIKQSKNLL